MKCTCPLGWCEAAGRFVGEGVQRVCRTKPGYRESFERTRGGHVDGERYEPRVAARPMLPCIHRGRPTGQMFACQLCGQRDVDVPVLECAVHGECVHSKFLNVPADKHPVKVCMGPPMCREREE